MILEDVAALLPRKRRSLNVQTASFLMTEMVLAIRAQIDDPDPAWLQRLGQITAQTLVIGGGPPSYIPQDWVAELARQIPNAQMETIPVGPPVFHNADPEAFTRTALILSEPSCRPGQ